MVLVSISDRIATTRCDIAILSRAEAIAAVLAGRRVYHLRDQKLRLGTSATEPMLAEHRCPANAEESRAAPCYTPPF